MQGVEVATWRRIASLLDIGLKDYTIVDIGLFETHCCGILDDRIKLLLDTGVMNFWMLDHRNK